MAVEVRETIADIGKRDLFTLAKVILGYDLLIERVHRPVCDHFVQKDPYKAFTDQDICKSRLLLDPRGHFKTSIAIADNIQWMLNFPNITILKVSGTQQLTQRIVGEMKDHFLTNSRFRQVYPDFVPQEGKEFGNMSCFTIPARTGIIREPTISIATIESVKAGSHYWLIDGDDVVNEVNSLNREQLQATITRWNHIRPLLNPGGYRQLEGTRYDWSDLYGDVIERNKGAWKIFERSCWTEKENGEKDLLFPERFTLAELEQIRSEDPYLFSCQYLQKPQRTEEEHFPMAALMSHTVQTQLIPSNLTQFLVFDLAFTSNKLSDYTVGVFGGYDQNGGLWVFDIMRGRWSPYTIIDMIIHGYRRWSVQRVGIEDAAGSELLLPGLDAKCRELSISVPVDWIPMGRRKSSPDATRRRVESLSSLLKENKLWFNASMPFLKDMYMELHRFPNYKNDDIAVAISLLLWYRDKIGMDTASMFQGEPEIASLGYTQFIPGESEEDERLSAGLVG